MSKFIVVDNVLSEENRNYLQNFLHQPTNWFVNGDNTIHELLIEKAKDYFDLSSMIGYEMWCNFDMNYSPSWHFDKDEKLFRDKNILQFPLCSIVYYPIVDALHGGEFMTNDIILRPLTNRLVLFSPGIYHHVNPYRGIRKAISINPWNVIPSSYSQ